MYKCQECGKKYKTTKSAEKASMNGCTKCGGVDIELDVDSDGNDSSCSTQSGDESGDE